ncbi:hypothetical protein BC834DRAFT_967251 [Gloeopeniophorella convolvens]|nr:hypothetical protein BC834DRAFT_967251 [Gloeopeniophorella convolvens]
MINHRLRGGNRRLLLLFSFLTAASIVFFGATVFFLSDASDSASAEGASSDHSSPHWSAFTSSGREIVQVGASSRKPSRWHPGEKYLAYLPHSGFHNQRIALENALVLARILNRTLLVPPARLGNSPISYHKYDDLRSLLVLSGKQGLSHCAHIPPRISLPPECLGYFDYTHVSWDWLVDLASVAVEQPLVHPESLDYPWLESPPPDTEVFTLKDQSVYQLRFVDYVPGPPPHEPSPSRYDTPYPIAALAASDAQLLQLGSLFGSARLHLKQPAHRAARTAIRAHMAFANPHVRRAAAAVARALGGPDAFLAAHVRLADGPFRAAGERTVRAVWYRLVVCALRAADPRAGVAEARAIERRLVPASAALPAPPEVSVEHVPSTAAPAPAATGLKCPGRAHADPALAPLNAPLFVATDAADARALAPLRAAFPCMFVLRDFARVPAVRALGALASAHDGVPLAPFLAPLLDASVAARGRMVAGTAGSTFSTYVEDVLWRRAHGQEIVQRG